MFIAIAIGESFWPKHTGTRQRDPRRGREQQRQHENAQRVAVHDSPFVLR